MGRVGSPPSRSLTKTCRHASVMAREPAPAVVGQSLPSPGTSGGTLSQEAGALQGKRHSRGGVKEGTRCEVVSCHHHRGPSPELFTAPHKLFSLNRSSRPLPGPRRPLSRCLSLWICLFQVPPSWKWNRAESVLCVCFISLAICLQDSLRSPAVHSFYG